MSQTISPARSVSGLPGVPSGHPSWTRLSELLERSERREVLLDVGSACSLIRQLAAAVAEQQHSGAGDLPCDINRLGIVALSLFLGRRLHEDECRRQLPDLVTGVWVTTMDGSLEPLPRPLHRWLTRALELDGIGFESARDAWLEFERAVDESQVAVSSVLPFAARSFPAVGAPRNLAALSLRPSTDLVHADRSAPVPTAVRWRLSSPASAAVGAAAAVVMLAGLVVVGRGSLPPTSAQKDRPAPSKRGQLEVRTDPPGAQVAVDGLPIGESPLRIDLETGDHVVALGNGFDSVTQTVTVAAGRALSLAIPLAPAPVSSSSGWLMITAPVPLQVFENGHLLGTSGTQRIAMPSGRHTVEIVNAALGYRTIRDLSIEQDKTASVSIELPTVSR